MLLIEVHVARGTLTEQERQSLGRRLVDAMMTEEEGHAVEVIDAQRAVTQVLVHEPAAWVLGQRPAADPADPPRYLVRITVPASWRKEVSTHAVPAVTDALAETERAAGRDPERVREAPHAVILVDGVAEGSVGLFGRVMGSMDLADMVTRPYRETAGPHPASTADGRWIDPVCGMTVERSPGAITLEHGGVLYGFCHGMCRRSFADEHGIALS
ncbi:hypothetical protein [Streptomyces sp. VRA16 Mangrove soil]|uniref:hypothetical protein n=1 Tax=Streptomyces sp. VRA16 Mangrove soil TaxID=2817434 RepID=UPI001A9DE93D|nr:hypothetical protein [Streptomyces sp. VRA16 Mangrove soil]MBO1329988.1 hypothetical protein [Streptomyces sp. VRA16 Mangrove soil]